MVVWYKKKGAGNRRKAVLQYQKRRFPRREPQRVLDALANLEVVAKIQNNLLNE